MTPISASRWPMLQQNESLPARAGIKPCGVPHARNRAPLRDAAVDDRFYLWQVRKPARSSRQAEFHSAFAIQDRPQMRPR